MVYIQVIIRLIRLRQNPLLHWCFNYGKINYTLIIFDTVCLISICQMSGDFGELALVVGDYHIPHRAAGIPVCCNANLLLAA